MEEDDDMDIASEGGDFEIDLDYEFDAPRFFDLSRPEFPSEALEAARWFETARSCPPSPLVGKMVATLGTVDAAHMEHTSTTASLEEVKCTNPVGTHLDADTLPDFSVSSGSYEGRCEDSLSHEAGVRVWSGSSDSECVNITCSTLHSCMPQDGKGDRKSHVKRPFSKGSTLMKPTASQMAKHTQSLEVKNELWKSLITKSERSNGDPNDNAIREAKRQRLEGGHIFKVLGIKQHVDLLHKVSKKNGPADSNSRAPRLKITIPREPELETARRATAFRARRTRLKNTEDLQDGGRPTKFTFKARPLNRKILEAPSLPFPQKTTPSLPSFQEFHLKTHERAIKHSLAAAASSLIAENHIPDSSTQDGTAGSEKSLNEPSGSHQLQTVEGGNMLPKCRGRALNKKIASSKGDIGVFRSTKRETTKPKEFKLSTNRKCQPNPLTELFNKLSLAPEAWQPTAAEAKLQQSVQGSKENMINPVQ